MWPQVLLILAERRGLLQKVCGNKNLTREITRSIYARLAWAALQPLTQMAIYTVISVVIMALSNGAPCGV